MRICCLCSTEWIMRGTLSKRVGLCHTARATWDRRLKRVGLCRRIWGGCLKRVGLHCAEGIV